MSNILTQLGQDLNRAIYGKDSIYALPRRSNDATFDVHNEIIERLQRDLFAKSKESNAAQQKIKELEQEQKRMAQALKNASAELAEAGRRTASSQGVLQKSNQINGANNHVARMPVIAKAYTKHPLMAMAVLSQEEAIQNMGDVLKGEWAQFPFPVSHALEMKASTVTLPYYFIDKGFSSALSEFNSEGIEWGAKNFYRMAQLFVCAQAFVSCGVAWVDVVQGIFCERAKSFEDKPGDLADLTSDFYRATKLWRTQASNYDGNLKQLNWAIFNQLVKASNENPELMWNTNDDGSLGVYPLGIMKAFEFGGQYSVLKPVSKLTVFLEKYGPGTEAYAVGEKAGVFDFSQLAAATLPRIAVKAEEEVLHQRYRDRSVFS